MRLICNIGLLAGIVPEGVLRLEGAAMDSVGTLRDAWLLIGDDGRIAAYGRMGDFSTALEMTGACRSDQGTKTSLDCHSDQGTKCRVEESLDAAGGMVMPAFCDSHTHIVYAGSREGEFRDKIEGLSYAEIAARGGGILNSADRVASASEDELFDSAMARVAEMTAQGTGSIEIKSGYGLSPEGELKILRVIDRIKKTTPALVRSTFLGAHAVGRGYTHESYVDMVCDLMQQAAPLADFVDVFCEQGFFTTEDAARILEAGAHCGLRPKIHANQLAVSGGVQVGVKYNALSVDHLEHAGEAEIEALRGSETMPTMLPGSAFFLGLPFGKAREFVDAGLGVALASDFNPGSSPSGDMRFVMALGCIRQKLTPERAFNAVTLNGAYAMGVSGITGSITLGKRADLILTRPGWTIGMLPYLYTTPFIRKVFLAGKDIQ